MNAKNTSFRKYSRQESLLLFEYYSNTQKEVIEAVELGLAEIIECKIGEDEVAEFLFVKVKEATKKRKSRWQNVSENEAVAIEYTTIEGHVFMNKCKITTIKSIEQKFLEDEGYPLLEEMNKSEVQVDFNPNSKGGDGIIKIDLRNGIENLKVKRKQY